ncbi:MAG: hypothetical protein AAGA70_09965 [Pseudomonadota bacterium]
MGMVVRVAILVIGVLTFFYVCAFFYLREGQKMRLEEEWVGAGRPGSREDWVAERLRPFADRTLRRLVLWIYALPISLLVLVVALTN